MNLTIYVDLLFLLNFIINYIVLCSTAFITATSILKKRTIAAAALGALYSVIIFFPQFKLLNLIIFKLAISIIILLISFKYNGIILYIKRFITYYIINLIYGGGMYAFCHFTSLGSKMNYSNGVYYIDMPLWAVLLLAFAIYFLIKLFGKISESRERTKNITDIEVKFENTSVQVKALIDTGNSLVDPVSLMQVLIIENTALKNKLNETFLNKAVSGSADALPLLHEIYPNLKIRIIPFQDITGNKKIIYAFKPEKITDMKTGKEIANTLIGIIGIKLAQDNSYNALLHNNG